MSDGSAPKPTGSALPGGSFAWVNDAGFGVIDPERALEQAALATDRTDRTEE